MQTIQTNELSEMVSGRDLVIGLLFPEQGSKFFYVLRWIVLLPASLVWAFFASTSLLLFLESVLQYVGISPDSILEKVFFKLSCVLLGVFYVETGIRIAPAYKENSAAALCGLLLFIIGAAFATNEYGLALNLSLVLVGGIIEILYMQKTGWVPKGILSYSKK